MVQGFIDKLSNTPSQKHSTKLKIDLEQYIRSHFIKQNEVCRMCGISRSIIYSAKAGNNFSIESAKMLCDALNV